MFENLTNRFEGILRNIRGKGRLGADEVEEVLREIRVALLDADVHLGVVRTLQDRIRERALGEELSGVLNPGQQVVRIVLEELTGILGGATMPITFARSRRRWCCSPASRDRARPRRPPSWRSGQGEGTEPVACGCRPGEAGRRRAVAHPG